MQPTIKVKHETSKTPLRHAPLVSRCSTWNISRTVAGLPHCVNRNRHTSRSAENGDGTRPETARWLLARCVGARSSLLWLQGKAVFPHGPFWPEVESPHGPRCVRLGFRLGPLFGPRRPLGGGVPPRIPYYYPPAESNIRSTNRCSTNGRSAAPLRRFVRT